MSSTHDVVLVMIEPPLPFGNAAARWYYVLLKQLVTRGHRVRAFATTRTRAQADEALALFSEPEYDLRCYPQQERRTYAAAKWASVREPFSYVFSERMRADLGGELARGYGVLHLEQLWSGWLAPRDTTRTVVNVHFLYTVDLAPQAGDPPRPFSERTRFRHTQWAEQRLLRRFSTITTLTPRLSQCTERINPRARVQTIPLALDHTLYDASPVRTGSRAPVVGLIGSFDWPPSRRAARRLIESLWPQIKARVPDARLVVVGRSAARALAEFRAVTGLEIHEDVPDARPYFVDLDVLLYAPTEGSGMKVKVLEAMAHGVPVVTTTAGAEGLDVIDGVHADVSDVDAVLIDRCVALLRDPSLRARRAEHARTLVRTQCDPERCVALVESVHARIAAPVEQTT
ncbi:MAG TPA: glycosyltransferase family 4 protein [Gemmatimonadaceae bacterium]|nr:glycosyltransferase family 4 protein [Gemmatimonadaceae bacterium]